MRISGLYCHQAKLVLLSREKKSYISLLLILAPSARASFIHFSEFQSQVNTSFSSPPPCTCSPLQPPCLSIIDMTEQLPPLKKWEKSAQWDTHLGLWRPLLLPGSPNDSLLSG